MSEPTATALRMWGQVRDAPTIPWDEVRARLESCPEYWLVTVQPDGMPTPRPVWGVWLDDRLLLSVGSTSHWRGIETHPQVAVHLPDPLGVVIVAGRARKATGDEAFFRRVVDRYNPKYSWGFEPTEPMVVDGVMEVLPSTVLAWTTVGVEESAPDMTFPTRAARWTFT